MTTPATQTQTTLLQPSAELTAQLDTTNKRLEAVMKELQDERTARAADREATARAQVDAVIAKMCGPNDTRFPKELLDNFKGAYLAAKLATLSENADVKTLAGTMLEHLDKIAAAQPPAAPGGEKKPADTTTPKAGALTKEDFAAVGSAEADAKIAAAIDTYIADKGLTGPDAAMRAFNALATAAGVTTFAATAGYSGGDAAVGDDDE